MINHPEKNSLLNYLIEKKPSEHFKVIGTYGSKACSLTKTAISSSNYYERDIKICPWHYELEFRNDRLFYFLKTE